MTALGQTTPLQTTQSSNTMAHFLEHIFWNASTFVVEQWQTAGITSSPTPGPPNLIHDVLSLSADTYMATHFIQNDEIKNCQHPNPFTFRSCHGSSLYHLWSAYPCASYEVDTDGCIPLLSEVYNHTRILLNSSSHGANCWRLPQPTATRRIEITIYIWQLII